MEIWFHKMPRRDRCRIGIVDMGNPGWSGGSRYIQVLAYSLGKMCQASDVELCLLTAHNTGIEQNLQSLVTVIPLAPPHYFRGERRLRGLLAIPDKSALLRTARDHRISALLPLRDVPFRASDVKTIGWIPDFQHVYLPEFFSDAARQHRDHAFRDIAE